MRASLIVQQNVYHQRPGQSPTGANYAFERHLGCNDPTFVHPHFIVGSTWQELPLGHLKSVDTFVLKNEDGKFPETVPSPEEKNEMASHVVEIAMISPEGMMPHMGDYIVRPGASFVGSPQCGRKVVVRSLNGLIPCSLMVVPR